MSKRLFMLNALLGVVALGFASYIVWELVRPAGTPTAGRGRPAASASTTTPTLPLIEAPPGSYGIIASRNLFNPSRSEVATTAPAGPSGALVGVPRPTLYGVVLKDGAPVAYLEDPVTKRVAGYRVGDAVAGGTLASIAADSVVVARPDGSVDVRLHDPTKPRLAATPPAPGSPVPQPNVPGAQPPAVPTPQVPTLAPPPATTQVPRTPGPAYQTPQTAPTVPPGRRPLPPNLLRRVPDAPSDGSGQ